MANVIYSENCTDYAITLTNANQQYSQLLPEGVKKIEFQARQSAAIRFAFAPGKVATPTDPYTTLKADNAYSQSDLYLNKTTIYFGTDTPGTIVELKVWF